MTSQNNNRRAMGPLALLFAIVFPTLVTLAYFVWLADADSRLQQTAYAIGKTIQFALPAVWVLFVLRQKPAWRRPTARGIGAGLAFGLLVLVAMMALYHAWLKPVGFFDGPAEKVVAKVEGLGIRSLAAFAALGVFYALAHALLEEYYWRWFVFAQLRRRTSLAAAIGISSLGFTAHHVILLAVYFGWTSPATWLFSLGVAMGGAVWAWLYEKSGSLAGPWLSHCFIDAAIFLIGYDLVFAQ